LNDLIDLDTSKLNAKQIKDKIQSALTYLIPDETLRKDIEVQLGYVVVD